MRENDSNHLLYKKMLSQSSLSIYAQKWGRVTIPSCRGDLETWEPLDGHVAYIQLNLERQREGIQILPSFDLALGPPNDKFPHFLYPHMQFNEIL